MQGVDRSRRDFLTSTLAVSTLGAAAGLMSAAPRSGFAAAPAARQAGAALAAAEPTKAAAASPAAQPIQPFPLQAVRLLPGPYLNAQHLDARYMLSLEPDRLLHNFRVNAGLQPKAPVYGGWESVEPWVEIRCHGHTLGHYLSACAMMFASTGDAAFKQRVDYIVSELQACQAARGNGLVCAFPDNAEPLTKSLAGQEFAGVPWYTMHKVMAGLRDAYIYGESEPALSVLTSLTDWIDSACRETPWVGMQKMLDREHGGMSEVLADVYALTGNEKYATLARGFVHNAVLGPLAGGRDVLDGLHSNTQIPKIIGVARLQELKVETPYSAAPPFFWRTVVGKRSFATGGNGDLEHFFPPAEFENRLQSAKTMETCCTHNMLRLTRQLFLSDPSVTYADYYERALFNGILASQDPQSGMMTYFQSTRPGYVKLYHTPVDSFWCCTGSGMENHAKYGDSIYFHDDVSLCVNLFIASELKWAEKGVRLTQETRFPDEPSTRLTIHTSSPTRLRVKLRHPAWCERATLSVNGRETRVSTRGGRYVEIDRTWRDGDVVEVQLPMQLRLAPLPNASKYVAVLYGPIVLAGRLGKEGITPGSDIIVNERKSGEMLNIPRDFLSVALKDVKRTPAAALTFSNKSIELVPWHTIAHERYTLYWKLNA